MKKALVLALLLATAAAYGAAQQSSQGQVQQVDLPELKQGDIDMARLNAALTTKRRELFAQGMAGLSPEQQQTFWSIYSNFEKEKDQNMTSRMALVKRYTDGFDGLTDPEIAKMASEATEIERESAEIRLKYFKLMNEKLGAKIAGRFFHIDDYLTTLLRLSILDNMPAFQVKSSGK
jgi:hypothetical protein